MIDFTALYQAHAAELFRFALYLCGNRTDAEDICSETFVRAFAASDTIRADTIRAYLFTIARHLYLHDLRGKRPRTEVSEEWPDMQAGPEQRVVDRDELAGVLRALQQLPELDRAALLMRAVHGLPYEEIAAALSISLSAAKVKIHRARLALSTHRSTRL